MKIKECAENLKKNIPAVFLSLKDKDTPALAKILAGITVAYALSPIDLIPDFIPLIGYLDDIIILPALVTLTIKLIPQEVWQKNLSLSADLWSDGKPKKWYYAIPVIIIWIVLVFIIIRAILK